jgi:hypothetical protein
MSDYNQAGDKNPLERIIVWVLNALITVLNPVFSAVRVVFRIALPETPPAPEVVRPASETKNRITSATPAAANQVETVAAATPVKPGWFELPPEELPHPTYWPVVLALGIILLVFGFVTTLVISGVGIVLFILAMAGWIGDMYNAKGESES